MFAKRQHHVRLDLLNEFSDPLLQALRIDKFKRFIPMIQKMRFHGFQ
ncbi:hypothetical protein [Ferviditalea candida]|uniref:Uncharacterized protein n=1 Tax=Ferviditalea candida TaxID=3108399 RepID=A0ABU5ZGR6_9BACL|nr:hypothetical protein [Paenibacillaceae bacterium T2]